MEHVIKKDKYYRSRGSVATVIKIVCSCCQMNICTYQKDGTGNLYRLYLDRITNPEPFFKIPCNNKNVVFKGLPNIVCSCRNIIAVPMVYKKEGRLAFRLIKGSTHKNKLK